MDDVFSWSIIHREVDRMLFVLPPSLSRWQHNQDRRELVRAVYERTESLFGQHILDKLPVTAFPGTDLLGGVASVFVMRFDETVKGIVLDAEPNLNAWRFNKEPPLPEDICLFKSGDPFPTFVSITHEGRAWLINEEWPNLSGVFRESEKYRPEPEEFVFGNRYYCREYKGKNK